MAIVAVSVSPTGVGVSVGEYVAEALRVLQRQDRIRYEIGPMFTTLEGDLGEVLQLIVSMQEAMFTRGAQRVGTVIKIDERRDRPAHMEEKVEKVRRLLGEAPS